MSNYSFKEEGFENLVKCFCYLKNNVEKSSNLDYYFDSYSYIGIHREMLQDEVRTNAYRDAIEKNPQLFKGKIVMDIGAGSGVLSMFAIKAGAKHVYAIEKADIYKLAMKNIKENKMSDTITVINSFVEEVELEEKVDIIISEWMGYFLWFEGMFDSVLFAAKKLMKDDGMLFPNLASVFIAGCDYPNEFISDKYNALIVPNKELNLKAQNDSSNLLNRLKEYKRRLGDVFKFNKKFITTNNFKLQNWDLEKTTKEELDFSVPFEIKASSKSYVGGFVFWFDTTFSHGKYSIVLDTSPFTDYTHWNQGYL